MKTLVTASGSIRGTCRICVIYLICVICVVSAACANPGRPLSPMIIAAREGNVARITELAAAHEDVDQRAGVNDWTPLMHAIHKNQTGSVKALLEAHADIGVISGTQDALTMAAGYGYANIVQMLIEAGAKPSGATLSAAVGGSTDIDRPTVGTCQTETVRAILKAAPSLRTGVDAASLRVAKIAGCKDLVAMLED